MKVSFRTIFFIAIAIFALYRTFSMAKNWVVNYSIDAPGDFRNIYLASKNLTQGIDPYNDSLLKSSWIETTNSLGQISKDLPGKPDRPYIYPPWTSLIFAPLVLLSFNHAAWLWYILLILSYVSIAYLLPKIFSIKSSFVQFIEILVLILAFKFTKGSFAQGQPASFAFVIALGSIWYSNIRKPILAGILLGLASFKFTIVLPFYCFYFFKFIKSNDENDTFDWSIPKTLLAASLFLFSYTVSVALLINQSILDLISNYMQVVSEFQNLYCNVSPEYYTYVLRNSTEWMMMLRYFGWTSVCDFLWIGSIIFAFVLGTIYVSKSHIKWSNPRLLLVLSLTNLLSTYHLCYDCICILFVYFIWEECPSWAKKSFFILFLFEILPSHEKLLRYLPFEIPLLTNFNNYELPLRISMMLIIAWLYQSEKLLNSNVVKESN